MAISNKKNCLYICKGYLKKKKIVQNDLKNWGNKILGENKIESNHPS